MKLYLNKATNGMTDASQNLPSSAGFLKVTGDDPVSLTRQQRVVLVRKGNELFNNGKIELARRVFLTARYTDGIVRVGDYYYKQNRPLDALRMYWQAPDHHKVEMLAEKMAMIIKHWLKDNEGHTGDE